MTGARLVRPHNLNAEIAALDAHLGRLVVEATPDLVALKGVGSDTAATLLVTAGDNPERLRSEAAFARLCGVAPIPASSGKITRHRLNQGGDRQANRALHLLAVRRMGWDPATQAYAARRTAEGKSTPEILRCLKRYLARQLYPLLAHTPAVHPPTVGPHGSRSEPATAPTAGERPSPTGPERSAEGRAAALTAAGGGALASPGHPNQDRAAPSSTA